VTIENLVRVAPPPVDPFEAFRGPWDVIEAELGTRLPTDYKDLIRLYGLGDFSEIVGIHLPRSWSPYMRLVSEVDVVRRVFEDDKDLPYPLWPSPGGLLPCGKTDFGDYIFWLTQGSPDDWRVVVWGRGFGQFEVFDCDLTDFLAGVTLGKIVPKDFPDDLADCEERFRPYNPWRDPRSPLRRMAFRFTGRAVATPRQWAILFPTPHSNDPAWPVVR
jgi:hypothetical protein